MDGITIAMDKRFFKTFLINPHQIYSIFLYKKIKYALEMYLNK